MHLFIHFAVINITAMRAPQRVLYVCLIAAKIVVRRWSHGFCHTGTFTICAVFGLLLYQSVPCILPLIGFVWAHNPSFVWAYNPFSIWAHNPSIVLAHNLLLHAFYMSMFMLSLLTLTFCKTVDY
jgi:hypothetical protein